MNVLSLFDGMSCGQIALGRAGIEVETYYAAELDKYAIAVTQANYPDTVQLGDVLGWRDWDIDWSSIDLLIGGSPCQGFSFAGKQLAFDDPRSKLFFVYVDILNHIRTVNPSVKFMLENVKMKAEYLDIISAQIGVDPVFINSKLVSAQNRQRYYWANWRIVAPSDRDVTASQFAGNPVTAKKLSHKIIIKETYAGGLGLVGHYKGNSNSQRVYDLSGKIPTLLTNNTGGNNPLWLSTDGGKTAHRASIAFCEFLQTVPDGYTNAAPENQAYRMLGNGWTVDVVAEIFKSLKEETDAG